MLVVALVAVWTATPQPALAASGPTAYSSPWAASPEPGAQTTTAPAERTLAWIDRGQLVLGYQQALDALDRLPADSPAPRPWGPEGRERWFGQAWQDVDGNGCDTRNDILGRDLADPDYSRAPGRQGLGSGAGRGSSQCPDATVYAGTLDDPYTGATIAFRRGETSSAAVQIDHVVPLNYLYAHGAWQWEARERALAANDPLNLLAVDGRANQGKGNCGPATCPEGSHTSGHWDTQAGSGWWPPSQDYRCAYAARFVSVLAAYELGVPDADRRALRRTLASCVAGGDGSDSVADRAARVHSGDVLAALRSPAVAVSLGVGLALVGVGLILAARQRTWTHRVRRRR